MGSPFARALEGIQHAPHAPLRVDGRVDAVVGQTFEVAGLSARIGSVLQVEREGERPALAEVVGFRKSACIAMPLTHADGVARGARAILFSGDGGTPELFRAARRVGERAAVLFGLLAGEDGRFAFDVHQELADPDGNLQSAHAGLARALVLDSQFPSVPCDASFLS